MSDIESRPHLLVIPVQDIESMFGLPAQGGIARGPLIAERSQTPQADPEVQVEIKDQRLIVRFVGNP
ncbi:MAG: hypothetical protein MUO52_18435, partial [Desulfobacterales bacterium]|nr:hypothetical protein [Desulfobacterales bacterium]